MFSHSFNRSLTELKNLKTEIVLSSLTENHFRYRYFIYNAERSLLDMHETQYFYNQRKSLTELTRISEHFIKFKINMTEKIGNR